MIIGIFLFLTYSFSRWIKYRRGQLSRSLRAGVVMQIFLRIKKLIRRGKLQKLKGPIPYQGIIGSTNPEKIIVLQSGVHGPEDFAIEVLLNVVTRLDQNFLKKSRVQIHVIPIVNYFGFQKHERTNQNGVDLVRNSPYQSRHKRIIPFVSGWRTSLVRPITWLVSKTWYFMGHRIEKETEFLIQKFDELIHSGKEIVFFDFHTGNTSPKTTIWRHELDQRMGVPLHLERVLKDNNIVFEPIDYGTHGGLYEYLADTHQKHDLNAFTVELGVLEDRSYAFAYFFDSVFLPPRGKRKEFLEKETEKVFRILKQEINHRDAH
jgi:hypothetical protein